jgi:hypothetical protein
MKQKMKYFAVYWIQKRLIHEFVYSFQAVGGRACCMHMRLSRNFIIYVVWLESPPPPQSHAKKVLTVKSDLTLELWELSSLFEASSYTMGGFTGGGGLNHPRISLTPLIKC